MHGIDDRVMQKALKQERRRLDKTIKEIQEERSTLHLDEIEALERRIEDLQESVKGNDPANRRHRNKRGFWHTRWRCLVCVRKTSQFGEWTCPQCNVEHLNSY